MRDDPVLTVLVASAQVDLCKKLKAWGRAFATQRLIPKDQDDNTLIGLGLNHHRNTYFKIPHKLCLGILKAYASVLASEQAAWLKDICVLLTNNQFSASEDRSKIEITLHTALRLCVELLQNTPGFYSTDAVIDQVVSRGHATTAELMLAKNTAIGEAEIEGLIELAQAHKQDYTATRLMRIKERMGTGLCEGVQSSTAAKPEEKFEEATALALRMGR